MTRLAATAVVVLALMLGAGTAAAQTDPSTTTTTDTSTTSSTSTSSTTASSTTTATSSSTTPATSTSAPPDTRPTTHRTLRLGTIAPAAAPLPSPTPTATTSSATAAAETYRALEPWHPGDDHPWIGALAVALILGGGVGMIVVMERHNRRRAR